MSWPARCQSALGRVLLAASSVALRWPVLSRGQDLVEGIPPLRPARGEVGPAFWEQHGLGIIMGAVVASVAAGGLAWYLRRPKPVALIPPEVEARAELAALAEAGEDGAIVSRVGQVLRRYFSKAYGLPGEEATTAEFLAQLEKHTAGGSDMGTAVGDFLQLCDRRKFSPEAPGPPVNAATRARELLEIAERRRAERDQAQVA